MRLQRLRSRPIFCQSVHQSLLEKVIIIDTHISYLGNCQPRSINGSASHRTRGGIWWCRIMTSKVVVNRISIPRLLIQSFFSFISRSHVSLTVFYFLGNISNREHLSAHAGRKFFFNDLYQCVVQYASHVDHEVGNICPWEVCLVGMFRDTVAGELTWLVEPFNIHRKEVIF